MRKLLIGLLATSAVAVMVTGSAFAEKMPKKVGYVVNYATHEWYQNVIKGMKDRAAQLGFEVEVKDANLDAAKQIAAAVDTDANIIFGATIDENLVDQVKITVIATGFDETKKRLRELTGRPMQPQYSQQQYQQTQVYSPNPQMPRQPVQTQPMQTNTQQPGDTIPPEEDEFDIPAFLRQRS